MIDLFSAILDFFLIFDRWKFNKKKKERRKYEKENNLPKKFMIYPLWTVFGVLLIILIVLRISVGYFNYSDRGIKRTKEKIIQIQIILEKEKNAFGKYPEKLNIIERNNPFRKNITLDYWKNEFHYEQIENGLKYNLISMGKDRVLGTDDDILISD